MEKVRVRIAPSPTGKLHIGTARTALFNYLFAKKNKGVFILRFEDTDTSRSTQDSEKEISRGFKWLGINWDEGPYRQMEGLDLYQNKAKELKKQKLVYQKDSALWLNVKKVIDKYKIPCKKVKVFRENDKNKKIEEGYLISLPEKDLILGKISANVEDFVIMRQNGIPTYHFAVVVDDEDMKITHVIRGQDHFSNTPKHYLLQKALGYKTPLYAHIPLTLTPEKKKLSKRFGAVSIANYRGQGYLKEALINFIVLLGWHPGEGSEQEIFSLKELEQKFSIEHMGKSAAIFDIKRLNSLNGHYIRQKSAKELLDIIRSEEKLIKDLEKVDDNFLEKIIEIEKTRIEKLADIKDFDFYFKEPKYDSKMLIFRKSNKENTKKGPLSVNCLLLSINSNNWENQDKLNDILSDVVKKENLTFGDVFWPVRVALSGVEKSPSPSELLWVFGKDESTKRIKKALELLS